MAISERTKKFEAVLKGLKKKMPDSIWYKEKGTVAANVVRTGLPSLDMAFGTGGLPKKRIIELYGPEASGKTSLCLHLIAQVQKLGGNVVYLDAENSLDPIWAAKLGVDVSKMALMQQENAELVLDAVRLLVQSRTCDMFVVDSVAALVTQDELEAEMGDAQVGVQARLMSKLMKVINVDLLHTDTIALFTNQMRDKIGVRFGNPETTPGGKALKYYASMRIDVRKASDEQAYAANQHHAKVRIAKNKMAPPFGIGHFRIDPLIGILPAYSIVDPAVELGIIKHEKGSKTYEFGTKSWKSENMLVSAVLKDQALSDELSDLIYKKLEDNAKQAPMTADDIPLLDDETEQDENSDETIEE